MVLNPNAKDSKLRSINKVSRILVLQVWLNDISHSFLSHFAGNKLASLHRDGNRQPRIGENFLNSGLTLSVSPYVGSPSAQKP